MPVTRIWDEDNGVWQLVGGTVGAEAGGAGLYLPLAGGTMTGDLFLNANPTAPTQAATKAYVDSLAGGGGVIPTGLIIGFGGTTPPTGFLLCDGSLVSRTTYATLFGVIGTAYGVGDGSTTFGLPDLRGRFPLGKATAGTGSTLGGTGGALGHTHTGPSHTHTGPSHTHDQGSTVAGGGGGATSSAAAHQHGTPSITTTSDSHAHTFSDTTSGPSSSASIAGSNAQLATNAHTHTVSGNTSSDGHSHTAAAGTTGSGGGHSHTIPNHTHDLGVSAGGGTGATGSSGTGATGANDPPFQTVNYIVKT